MDQKIILLHVEIAKRAREMGIVGRDKFASLLIDLEAATLHFNLDCEGLLNADDSNFTHDICGIQSNINRRKTFLYNNPPKIVFENNFVPRYARES